VSLTGIALSCYFSKFQKSLTAFSKRIYIFSSRKNHPFFDKFMHHRALIRRACPPFIRRGGQAGLSASIWAGFTRQYLGRVYPPQAGLPASICAGSLTTRPKVKTHRRRRFRTFTFYFLIFDMKTKRTKFI